MLIRLQRIYNFWLFHAVILSFLDVLQSFYSNFISFFGTNLLTQWQLLFFACFLHRRKSISNGVQTPRNFLWIFLDQKTSSGPEKHLGGCSEGITTHQGAPGGPGAPWWVVPTSGAPWTASLLYKYPNIPETLGESTKYSSSRRRVQNHQIQSRHHLGWGSPPPLVPLRWCVSSSL